VSGFGNIFAKFVREFGGEVIPEGSEETADYLFRCESVIAELKTLEKDALPEHVRKLGTLVASWQRRGSIRCYGHVMLDLQTVPLDVQREWLHLVESPIEGRIRKANAQIRSTKERFQMPGAQGLLLIANDGNLLHTEPKTFMISIARILQKRDETGAPKFPEIRGVSYFSFGVPAAGTSELFWVSGTIDSKADRYLSEFQHRMRDAWVDFYGRNQS
jgi:hypothetical protein